MFGLFSQKVSDDTKARMAARLLSLEKPEARLDLPEYLTVTAGSELLDFVQPHSWDFFMILRVEADWLTWPLDKVVSELLLHTPASQYIVPFHKELKLAYYMTCSCGEVYIGKTDQT